MSLALLALSSAITKIAVEHYEQSKGQKGKLDVGVTNTEE
jgi:hypothetical protein